MMDVFLESKKIRDFFSPDAFIFLPWINDEHSIGLIQGTK